MLKNNGFHNRHSPFTPSFGLGTSLALDFIDGTDTLDPRITFTRSTTATFTNSAGLIATAAINAARFDYDPVTLQPKGLLIEEQRTQLLLNSSLAGTSLATQNVTVTAVAHTLSFYGTGTVTLSGTSTAGPLVGTGAYPARSTLTFTPTAGTLTLTVTGTVEFAQLEIGAFATSFIPSAASQVTRAADSAVMTGTNFSSWYNVTQGTLYSEYINYTTVTGSLFSMDDGSTNNRIIQFTNTGTNPYFRVVSGGADQANFIVGTVSVGVSAKFSAAYQVNNFAASVNGASVVVDTSGNVPTGLTTARIGQNVVSGAYLNGNIKRIAYYNRRLANSELTAITS